MRRFTFKVPKKFLLWTVAILLGGGIYGIVQDFRQASEPSFEGFHSACVTMCIPTVGESESGREYCDCSCQAFEENYSADELKAFIENKTQAEAWSDARFREVLASCVASWKGPEYPKSIRQPFLDECSRGYGEAGLGICECIIGQVERQYSLSEYMEIDLKMEQDPAYVPPGFTTAIAACTQ